jgi:hypothetical protein
MLGILTMLTIHSQLGQPIYAATHTSGYDHGCSDAQISDPSGRYINQPGKGSDFHTDAFMQAYNDGFDTCSGNSNNNNNSGSSEDSNSNSNDHSDQFSNSGSGSHSGLVDKACGWINRHPAAAGILGHVLDFGTLSTLAQGYCGLR